MQLFLNNVTITGIKQTKPAFCDLVNAYAQMVKEHIKDIGWLSGAVTTDARRRFAIYCLQ
jgi:hypothetical protein